jgi:hypothetical protein
MLSGTVCRHEMYITTTDSHVPILLLAVSMPILNVYPYVMKPLQEQAVCSFKNIFKSAKLVYKCIKF